ncbi:DNA-directed RNA polymerase I subunit rpa49 [Lambiella insularis]|nr:DNA-directed RNA polymerase I subunit rpa49 [Lambiella insularis]
MSDKKRKRGVDEVDRPSKKKLPEARAAPQTVRFSAVNAVAEWAPAIATAPGLDLPTNFPLQAFERPRTNTTQTGAATSARRSASSQTELLLHCSAHPKLDYTAREELFDGPEGLLRHYVGVYDPATGELKVVQARKVVVRPTLRSIVAEADDDSSGEEQPSQSRFAARNLLGEAFGTKKSQKAIRARTENAIASPHKASQASAGKPVLDPLASAVIEYMSQSTSTMPTREDMQADVDESKPRPKANMKAETPAEVYTIEDLVGTDTLRVLSVREWQTAVEAKKDVQTSSKYVSRRLVKVVASKNVMRLKALRFILLLIDWYSCLRPGLKGAKKLPQRDDIRKAVGGEITDSMIEGLRKRFAPQGAALNKWAIDNLTTHVCALALVIDQFEVDTCDLRDDLKLETKEISKYFQEIGCKVAIPTESEMKKMRITKAESTTHKIAKLKLPLEFPRVRMIAPKRR